MCTGPNCSAGTFTALISTIAHSHQPLCSTNYRKGAVIVYLLFTEEKPHYFLLINNWHVWVGWGTKSHSLSVFFPSGCVFVCEAAGQTLCLCCVSEQTTDCALLTAVSPAWVLSAPCGCFVPAELRVISGKTLSYLMLHSVLELERKEFPTSYLKNVILHIVDYRSSNKTQWTISPSVLRNILLK